MSAELAIVSPPAQADLTAIERVVVAGDLSKLTPDERWNYYRGVCQSVGLNPFTQPFLYITLGGKLVLYATKGAADQLRDNHHISIGKPAIDLSDGLCIVTVTATDRTGRTDSDLGIVPVENLRGDAKANAILKAVTKAKRRVTLSMCGLGMLDETEVETIPNAQPANVPVLPTPTPLSETPNLDAQLEKAWAAEQPPVSHAADAETRARFEANWTKGVARAVACGVVPDDKPGPEATKGTLNAAQRELMEAIQAREKLNATLIARVVQVRATGATIKDIDPVALTEAEVHEGIADLDAMLAPAESDDDSAPF